MTIVASNNFFKGLMDKKAILKKAYCKSDLEIHCKKMCTCTSKTPRIKRGGKTKKKSLRIFATANAQAPYAYIANQLKQCCADSHANFKHPYPLWKNSEFFIQLPFKLNEDANPIKVSHSRMTPNDLALAREECKRFLALELIKRMKSNWACPTFYVNKRTEQLEEKRGIDLKDGYKTAFYLPNASTNPPLAISKIQSSYARDCHDSSSQRTNSRTIGTGNPNHTDQALRGFHMMIPASHFNRPLGVGFTAAKLMRSLTPRVNLSIRGHFIVTLKPRSISVNFQRMFDAALAIELEYKVPIYHDLQFPLLKDAKKEVQLCVDNIRSIWAQCGCTIIEVMNSALEVITTKGIGSKSKLLHETRLFQDRLESFGQELALQTSKNTQPDNIMSNAPNNIPILPTCVLRGPSPSCNPKRCSTKWKWGVRDNRMPSR
ncbi:polyprotein [Sesamum angolense]|uniref:Polyprotein n=1 Tax=Sesamum angolense TaxID=2727404 RepID=A0AAE2BZJ1_9LAMI|nr:polyprotein [Sesamum angolense]